MKILENFIESKTGNMKTCEDYIYVNDNFAAVIDGVSSKTKSLYDNKTTGQLAVDLIIAAIGKFQKDISAENAIMKITENIKHYYLDNNLYDKAKTNPAERAAACISIYSAFHKQVWIVGDCQCLLNEKVYTNEFKMDDTASEVRSLFLKMEILKGKTIDELLINDTGREYITPLLNNQALFENDTNGDEYSYGVLNGFTVPTSMIKIIQISETAKFVVLASDGYPILKETLEESEKQLKYVMEHDPLCIHIHKCTKGLITGNISFDDRSYLKIEI